MRQFPGAGTIEWIGIRPARGAEIRKVEIAVLDPGSGILGDHYAGMSGKRQVTLIQSEHLPVITSMLHCEPVRPEQLRRNIVVSGVNLLALKDKSFTLGDAVLEFTGLCHPCSQMERTLGAGGYNAMRGHGGITARVIRGGNIRIGDNVKIAGET